MSQHVLNFSHYTFEGLDAEKFLQGQVTVNVSNISAEEFRPTAICNLKGRVLFGIWLRRHSAESLDIIISTDMADAFAAHVKKYAAFSKATLAAGKDVILCLNHGNADFSFETPDEVDPQQWQETAIQQGQFWITQQTTELFQPQELRLHQRQGVNYDKGCYLGQEVIARLWFKAKPKAWLHAIQGSGEAPQPASQLVDHVQVVNSIATKQGYIALVIARPDALAAASIQILELPESLQGEPARPQS